MIYYIAVGIFSFAIGIAVGLIIAIANPPDSEIKESDKYEHHKQG